MRPSPYLHIDRIEFAVTHACTGRCRHCSAGGRINRPGMPRHVPQEEAAIRELILISD